MNRDYSALLMEYPEVISKEQVYRICHISKRKATWLLENGIIPCKDSGKKTRRFQVRTIDVINYLLTLEEKPQKVATPVGLFTSTNKEKKTHPITHIPDKEIQKELYNNWIGVHRSLTTKEISQLTGYNLQTVNQWVASKKLQCVYCPDGRKVAKQWLIQFISDYIHTHPTTLSPKLKVLMNHLI